MNGANMIAEILKLEGVEFISCFPNSSLINSAHQAGIRTVLARQERVAVNIADGYSRTSNGTKIGACTMQETVGLENSFSAIAQAFSDSVPILLLPCQLNRRRLGVNPIFADDLHACKTVTKWIDCVNFADRIPEMMRRAFTYLRTGRRGPVILEVPTDVAAEECGERSKYNRVTGWRTSADPVDVERVARALSTAKNPILHVGQGIFYAQAWEELREFAELTQIPVMTTIAGKSAFPENHPLSLGYGGYTATKAVNHFLTKADLVFSIGSSLTTWWLTAPIPSGKIIIQSTVDDYDINKDYPVDYALIGDAKLVLRQLINEIKRTTNSRVQKNELVDNIARIKREWIEEWIPKLTSNEIPINPLRVIWDLMKAIDRKNTIVTHDAGYPRDHLAPFYESLVPRGYLGWGNRTTLGYSLGGSIGAKLAEPKKAVINIMGDAAIGMTGMDLETAAREKIPILTIVLHNSVMTGYSRITPSTHKLSGDYAKFAEAMGGYSEVIEQPDEIIPSIKRALASDRIALLDVITKEETSLPQYWT